jgi:hypothetical protein
MNNVILIIGIVLLLYGTFGGIPNCDKEMHNDKSKKSVA